VEANSLPFNVSMYADVSPAMPPPTTVTSESMSLSSFENRGRMSCFFFENQDGMCAPTMSIY
jgi:hypothetical protein